MSKVDGEKFDSVWDAIAETQEEAVSLRMRSELMDKIADAIMLKLFAPFSAEIAPYGWRDW
jgi:predicted XRE-type DNA-binding protein